MNDKIKYLNDTLDNELNYREPKYLYKYRPFDEYTFDMLENEYLFLCKASNLDDKSECDVSLDINKLVDLDTCYIKKECINKIIEMISPFMSKKDYEIVKNKFLMFFNTNCDVKSNCLDFFPEPQEICWPIDINSLIKSINDILNKLDNHQIKELIQISIEAKNNIGICSLCDSPNIEKLWDNYYADYNKGYCIEYDVADYEFNSGIFPVIYTDERTNNLVLVLVESIVNQMITSFCHDKIITDKTQFIRLFLTKNTLWDYQQEWRLLGSANKKIKAPKIHAIYIGGNALRENVEKIKKYANENNIQIFYRLGR